MMTKIRLILVGGVLVLSCAVAGCDGNGTPDPGPSATPSPPSAVNPPASPAGSAIEGTFDVGGHRLFLTCAGSGAPTIVYLHGSITDANVIAHQSAGAISSALSAQYRVCRYDRRNVGNSDTVDAVQTPMDALNDLHRLLAAAEVEPPYVLLGASFGGMLAYLYANTYPDEVVGMLLLDSMFPDELSLDYLVPPKDRYKAFDAEDEAALERISHYKVLKLGQRYIGKEPKIPVTYLASIPEGYDTQSFGAEYDTKIVQLHQDYVDRFSPGTLKRVDAPHFMEPVIPDRIADEVRQVVAAAGQR
jgi:pimeloyl-ACP methyl ester carboxylesterase